MPGANGRGRTDEVKTELALAAEDYRVILDHDRNLVQAIFIVQFRPTGEIKRVIVKPESHRDVVP